MNLTAAYKSVLIELRGLREKVAELERKLETKAYTTPPEPVTLKRGPGRPRKVS